MQHHSTAAPGALAGTSADTTASIRAIVADHHRPSFGIPLDGEPAAPAAGGAPAGAPGQAPAHSTNGSPQDGPQVTMAVNDGQSVGAVGLAPAAPPPPAVVPAAPVTPPPAGPPGATPPAAPPQGQPAAGGGQVGDDAPLDSFPPEIRDYVLKLRKEAGDNRIKAKTAEDAANAAAEAAKQEWLEKVAKTFGLMQDDAATAELTPEQRVEQITTELGDVKGANDKLTTDNRALAVELAIYKGAHNHGADPRRLANARDFMSSITGLDPAAADFETQLAAAIGTAVEREPWYKTEPSQAQVVASAPQVPSGGDFAGGPGAGDTEPQSIDEYRKTLSEQRRRSRMPS